MSYFIVIGMAVWRITVMFNEEPGPWNVFGRIRNWSTGSEELYILLTCSWCLSVWVGLLFTILYMLNARVAFLLALPFAYSLFVGVGEAVLSTTTSIHKYLEEE
jgi:hypothetical protein